MLKNRLLKSLAVDMMRPLSLQIFVPFMSKRNICILLISLLTNFNLNAQFWLDGSGVGIGKPVYDPNGKCIGFKIGADKSNTYSYYATNYVIKGVLPEGFENISKLKEIKTRTISNQMPYWWSIDRNAFKNCKNFTSLYAYYTHNDKEIEYPIFCDTIRESAFENCINLRHIDLRGIRVIEANAFKNCGIDSLTKELEVKQMSDHAFESCPNLKKIDLGNTLGYVPAYAFANCKNLTSVKLPNCSKVGENAFYRCRNLTTFNLPPLRKIGDYAFEGCDSLKEIELANNVELGYSVFGGIRLTSVCIPRQLKTVGGPLAPPFLGCRPDFMIIPYYGNVSYYIANGAAPYICIASNYHITGLNLSNLHTLITGTPEGGDNSFPGEVSNFEDERHISYLHWDGNAIPFVASDTMALHLSDKDKDFTYRYREWDYLNKLYDVRPWLVKWCNIPTSVHNLEALPGSRYSSEWSTTFFVETDTLNLKVQLRDGDKLICVNPTGTTIISDVSGNEGHFYGNFKGVGQTKEVEDIDMLRYRLLCTPPLIRDRIYDDYNTYYLATKKRNAFNKAFTKIFPFKKFFTMPYSELRTYYNDLSVAVDSMFGENLDALFISASKKKLQSLRDLCDEITEDWRYSYIDAEAKKAFEKALNNAQMAYDSNNYDKIIAAYPQLKMSYDSIVIVVNNYEETLQNSRDSLRTIYNNCSGLSNTYSSIYPYIDTDKKYDYERNLNAAQWELRGYVIAEIVAAQSNLQTAYDTLVAEINRYNAALSESKEQLQTLVTNSSKLGKTAYTDVYPYIDSEAKNSLEAALAAANPESFDLQNIQTSLNQLQTAYDQMMALINTYSNDLTTAKQTLQQRLDEEGGLKDNSEFPFIDANLQKAYEDALKSATTAINGYDLAAINSAIEPLHQAYDKASKAMASLIGELAPAKSVLQTQINKCNDYLNDKPYYFTADYLTQLRSGAQRAEAVINTSDVNTIRQHITKLNTLFSEVDADIIANKNKVKQMQDSFARVFALMDTLKTIGLYDQAGERISPSGDLKEFSLFTFDGTSNGYNKCLQTIKSAQGIAVYMGASNSGFFDEGVIDYTNKCTDFINRFETEFASLDAKYQQEKGKLQEAIQRLQSLKEDNPTAYAKVDDNLKSQVEAKLTEWNVSGYAEVGRVYANADFSICDELQQAIGAYESLKENLSKMLANISKDCQTIANGANMNDVAVRSNYRVGDGLVTQEDQVSVIMGGKRTLIDGDGDTKVTLFSNAKTIDLDLNKECSNVVLAFANDESSLEHHFKVYATNNAQDNSSWKLQSEFVNTYSRKISQKYVARQFVGLDDNYRYLRIEFVATDECPKTTISELRVYHRANKFESEGADSCTQFFRLVAELQAQVDNQQEPSLESYEKVSAAYARFNAFEDSENFGLADFKETTAATYFNANKAVSLPHEVVGSIITGKNGRIVRDTRFDETHPVPANTAVVLQGEGGCSYYLIPTTDYVASVGGNLLHGMSADGTTQVTESEAKYYKFNKGTFAWAKENGAAFSAKVGDVFLAIPASMEQLESYDFGSIYGIGDNVPPYTGIGEITVSYKRKGIYDLNGRPINVKGSRDLMPGIYIVDGKKVVVK